MSLSGRPYGQPALAYGQATLRCLDGFAASIRRIGALLALTIPSAIVGFSLAVQWSVS